MLVSMCLSNWGSLPDFTGLFWQRQSTSWLNLDFCVCLLVMSLGRWGLLLWCIFDQGNCVRSGDRDGGEGVCHWLRTVGWDGWLGSLPK